MKEELLKFKKKIKGTYLYLLISGVVIFSFFMILVVMSFINKSDLTMKIFLSWVAIFIGFFVIVLSNLGYKNFSNKMNCETLIELKYKFSLCLTMLSFLQYMFLNKNIVILIILYAINIASIYDLFFSKTVDMIRYLQEIEEKKKKCPKDYH